MTPAQAGTSPTIKQRRWWPFIVTPFFIGISWTLLHPVVSVLTGELKCRNGYIDENSLEPSNLRTESEYSILPSSASSATAVKNNHNQLPSLCDAVHDKLSNYTNISCHRQLTRKPSTLSFDVARLVPTANTLEPSNEAIVLVVPYPSETGSWSTSQLHYSLLELLQFLASPQTVPWLAKTILLLSPTSRNQSLYDVVDVFLDSYMGVYDRTAESRIEEPLPPSVSNAMIRNLLVLDVQPLQGYESENNEVRILPHGRRGVLPNMDLVFVTKSIYSRPPPSNSALRRQGKSMMSANLLMHPHGKYKQQWKEFIKDKITSFSSARIELWAISLADLVMFAYTLLMGPYGAHSLALDRGIDALTIEARYVVNTDQKIISNMFVTDYIQKLELEIRALSNLHERLHHSTTLYLLPSAETFIKHEEYLVPNLLLVVPLVGRAATLALHDIQRFDLPVMGWMLVITLCATLWMDAVVAQQDDATKQNAWVVLTYTTCLAILYEKVARQRKQGNWDSRNALQSAQLVICLIAIYVHVPICFGHVSLSYPSALFWAPVLAFPSYADWYRSQFLALLMVAWIVLICPSVALLPMVFSGSWTAYLRFVYFPLHMMLSLSCVLGIFTGLR